MVENQIPKSNNDVICVHSVSMNTKSSGDIGANTVAEVQLENVIDIEKIAEAIIPKAIDLTTRTSQRISNEKKVIEDLLLLSKGFNPNLKVMPFGSATYGFGGPDTNFNICLVNKGNKFLLQFHLLQISFKQLIKKKKYCVDKFRNILQLTQRIHFLRNSLHFSNHRPLRNSSDFFVPLMAIAFKKIEYTLLTMQLN